MQNPDLLKTVMSPNRPVGLTASEGQSYASRQAEEHRQNHQFVAMLNAFRRSGGLARAPEVAARFRKNGVDDISPLAGWLVKRQVISFEWQSKLWMPLFQFNPAGMTLRAGLSAVLSELVTVYDDWDLAAWFAQPNAWLADCTPADTLMVAPPQVLHAAQAERFAQAG